MIQANEIVHQVSAPPQPKTPPATPRPLIPTPTGDPRLLEPSWGGQLTDEELTFIRAELFRTPALSRRWGFRPGQKTRADEASRRIAVDGDPDATALNRQLARPRKMAALAPVVDLSKLRN